MHGMNIHPSSTHHFMLFRGHQNQSMNAMQVGTWDSANFRSVNPSGKIMETLLRKSSMKRWYNFHWDWPVSLKRCYLSDCSDICAFKSSQIKSNQQITQQIPMTPGLSMAFPLKYSCVDLPRSLTPWRRSRVMWLTSRCLCTWGVPPLRPSNRRHRCQVTSWTCEAREEGKFRASSFVVSRCF